LRSHYPRPILTSLRVFSPTTGTTVTGVSTTVLICSWAKATACRAVEAGDCPDLTHKRRARQCKRPECNDHYPLSAVPGIVRYGNTARGRHRNRTELYAHGNQRQEFNEEQRIRPASTILSSLPHSRGRFLWGFPPASLA